MKKYIVGIVAAIALASTACTSIESAKVNASDIAANGDAVAVIQANALGLSALFHIVMITAADMDLVVNKLLVAEAKAMGGNKVQLLGAAETPKSGLYALGGSIIGVPMASASGIAVK